MTRARIVSLAIGLSLASACGRAPSPHVPPSASEHDAARENATCEGCHSAIFREWRASNHAEAFRHSTFRVAYAIEPLPFCVRCHAPRTDAERPAPPASDIGVPCGSCHRFDGTPARDTCAGCHEFPFPGTARLLQKTTSEHARSHVRASCTHCHAPRRGDHVDHRFFASRNEDLVRSAATITARREGAALVVRFVRAGVGHAFPTGDVFRRLRVTVVGGGKTKQVVLGREAKGRAETDRRPFVDGSDVAEVTIPLEGSGKVAWRVDYERVAHPVDASGEIAEIDAAIEVARGEL